MPTHIISTLLYAFDHQDRVLLLRRNKEPNRGLWSPGGGKLNLDEGESPHACACREAEEELGIRLTPRELHLTGIVSEQGHEQSAHWLMFLFEVKPKLQACPARHPEGTFQFFPASEIQALDIPPTDRDFIWPAFWRHRDGFFAAHCVCSPDGSLTWRLEESRPAKNEA